MLYLYSLWALYFFYQLINTRKVHLTVNAQTQYPSSTVFLGILACSSPIGCVIIGEVFLKAKMISKVGFIALGLLSVGVISKVAANRICLATLRITPYAEENEGRLQVLIHGPDYQEPQP